jgi:hypothetical protein
MKPFSCIFTYSQVYKYWCVRQTYYRLALKGKIISKQIVPLERGIKKMQGSSASACFLLVLLLLGSPIYAGMLFFSRYAIGIEISSWYSMTSLTKSV